MTMIEIILAVGVLVHAMGLIGVVVAINLLRDDIVVTRIITVPESIFSDIDPPLNFARKTAVVPMTEESDL